MERGAIRNPAMARVLRDFRGLQFERGITPTDIDLFVEFGGRVFILGEGKHGNSTPPRGQMLALERAVDGMSHNGYALLILYKHDVRPQDDVPINVALCKVTSYRSGINGHTKNFKPPRDITVRELIDRFRHFAAMQEATKC